MPLSKEARLYLIDGLTSEQYGTEIANAIDSNHYSPPVITGQAEVNLTPFQISDLIATPIMLVPAIPNKIIQVTIVDFQYTYVTTPYTLASSDLTLAYENSGGFLNIPAGGILDQTVDTEYAEALPGYQLHRNQGILLTGFNSDPTGGDGLLKVIVAYNIVG